MNLCVTKYQEELEVSEPGIHLNIKMLSYQYSISHCGDKTVWRLSYRHNMTSSTDIRQPVYIDTVLW